MYLLHFKLISRFNYQISVYIKERVTKMIFSQESKPSALSLFANALTSEVLVRLRLVFYTLTILDHPEVDHP